MSVEIPVKIEPGTSCVTVSCLPRSDNLTLDLLVKQTL